MARPNEPPVPDPLAYLLTWTTYGSWLPGDARGWVKHGHGPQRADPIREMESESRMSEDALLLDDGQRTIVRETIADHCRIRGWTLFAVNCRSNHVHVVVAADHMPDDVMRQFKAWCTRRLKELETQRRACPRDDRLRIGPVTSVPLRQHWWSERGSKRYLNDEKSLEDAVQYVLEAQDHPCHTY